MNEIYAQAVPTREDQPDGLLSIQADLSVHILTVSYCKS